MARIWSYDYRGAEFLFYASALLWGVIVAFPISQHMNTPAFKTLLSIMPEAGWGILSATLGAIGLLALWINGSLTPSPLLRSWVLGISAVGVSCFASGFAYAPGQSTAELTYGFLALALLFCSVRAARDYRP